MRARTEEHGDFTQRHAFFAQVGDALRDKAGLFVLVVRAHYDGRLPAVDARVKTLLEALLDVGNDRVRDVENRLRAAKVFFELDDLCGREELRKLQHVAMTRAAKRIDRLKLIADNSDVVVTRGHEFHDL